MHWWFMLPKAEAMRWQKHIRQCVVKTVDRGSVGKSRDNPIKRSLPTAAHVFDLRPDSFLQRKTKSPKRGKTCSRSSGGVQVGCEHNSEELASSSSILG